MDDQLVGVKANRLKDNNDLEEWKQKGRSWRVAVPSLSVQQCAVGQWR